MTFRHRDDLIGIFTKHPVAANLLMVLMLASGAWGINKLNTQFFPTFALDFVTVRVTWSGASPEDIEEAITIPLEQSLKNVEGLRTLTSTSVEGASSVVLEFEPGTDPTLSVQQVQEEVDMVRNLPESAEQPRVSRVIRYEPVSSLLITGPNHDLGELRDLVYRFEKELLERGIARVDISGLPSEEIAVQISTDQLKELGLSINQIGQRIRALSKDLPIGTVGRNDAARQLRFLDQRRGEMALEDLTVSADDQGRRLTLGDISTIERRPISGQTRLFLKGKPAIELQLKRVENSDTLDAARIVDAWVEETRPQLSPGIEIQVYNETWVFLQQRITLLVKNGVGGLALIIIILFLFLNGRVAFWVTAGIPISFTATLAILYFGGGSINMLSLFALIMTLGIIVDDAIVVGEDTMAHLQRGESSLEAAEGGARRMFAPVLSAMLSTAATFLPLMLIGGIMGEMLFEIPFVVICVIIASLVECFLVLPGHLRHSFRRADGYKVTPARARLDNGFAHFRDRVFRPTVTFALNNRWATLATAITILVLSVGLALSGRIQFSFFPEPEGRIIEANLAYVAGTPKERVDSYLSHMEETLYQIESESGEKILRTVLLMKGSTINAVAGLGLGGGTAGGDNIGSIRVELTEPDSRALRNNELTKAWKERLKMEPGIEALTITEQRGGPPGRDLEIRLTGPNAQELKSAALALQTHLTSIKGVSNPSDDLPYGQEQLILKMTPQGEALGLTVDQIGNQLRAAFDGFLAQVFPEGNDEIEVRVMLPDRERNTLQSIFDFDLIMPNGNTVPISNIVTIDSRQGFQVLRHSDGYLAATVAADVDPAVNNDNRIRNQLANEFLPELSVQYGVDFSYEGRAAYQRETFLDMQVGAALALLMIYLILAWVFGSYGWPLVVMTVIPFGLVGALWGHLLMGIDLTLLSLFGFFGLSGIVVNDSIILVVFYKSLKLTGISIRDAVVEAACQRLRAVILTSLTTIAGLTPLLFETSLQAEFLIPMAVSIAFGLAFATLIVLILVPTLLYFHESLLGRKQHTPLPATQGEPSIETLS